MTSYPPEVKAEVLWRFHRGSSVDEIEEMMPIVSRSRILAWTREGCSVDRSGNVLVYTYRPVRRLLVDQNGEIWQSNNKFIRLGSRV